MSGRGAAGALAAAALVLAGPVESRGEPVGHRKARMAAAGAPAVGERTVTFVDRSRRIRLPRGRSEPRTLVTVIRYPLHAAGPSPLVVFAHGFAVTPRPYRRLLQAWARAGYVVAAPIFPLENAHAPGGPEEADLINEPRDMSFVITRMLAADDAGHGFLAGLIDPHRIAVAGQSDGGEAALAAAFARHFRDPRIGAAIILSGAEIPGIGGYDFRPPGPPLLAAQGTADTVNRPRFTYALFHHARRPKFLLRLIGASHLPPYTVEQPQLGIVERVSTLFLDRYLNGDLTALGRMRAAGNVPGVAALRAYP